MHSTIMLNEIAKISTMKAVGTLSRFLHRPIGVEIKPVEINYLEELHLFDILDETIASAILPVEGAAAGVSFLTCSQAAMLELCNILLNRAAGQTQTFADKEITIISEVTNICVSHFLTAFADALQLQLSTRQIAIFDHGLDSQIERKVAALFFNHSHELLTQCSFNFHINHISGNFIVLLRHHEIKASLSKLSATIYTSIHQ